MTQQIRPASFLQLNALLAALLFAVPAAALDLETPARKFLATAKAPAVSLAVLKKGQHEPQTLALGQACVSNPVAMHDASVMKLGSVTKVFTGIRIAMLIEAGQISPETTVDRIIPDFPRGNEITVRHLLAHTSGLPEMLRQPAIVSMLAKPWQPEEVLNHLKTLPLDFTPGTRQQYSNSGYLLLGMIIEALTGESYAQQIRQQVAEPLGMKTIQAGDDKTLIAHEACGHNSNPQGQWQKPVMASQHLAFATGDLLGTAADTVRLVNLGQLLRRGLPDVKQLAPYTLANGQTVIRQESFPELALELESSQLEGLVWYRLPRTGMQLIGKDGMYPGFASWFLYDPVTETAVVALTNLETRALELLLLAIDVLEQQREANLPKL